MNKQPVFHWTHHHQNCTLCLECVDTCKALTLTNLRRIKRDETQCTKCETCSTICNNITTEYTYEKETEDL